MSEVHQNPEQLLELPETNVKTSGMTPEGRTRVMGELEQNRVAVGSAIDHLFTEHEELVQVNDTDSTETLGLEMPWRSSASARRGTAIITLARKKDSAGNSQTDLTFSAKGAWENGVQVTTVGGQTRVLGNVKGKDDKPDPSLSYETLDAQTWRANLEQVVAPKPKRGLWSLLGRSAVKRES